MNMITAVSPWRLFCLAAAVAAGFPCAHAANPAWPESKRLVVEIVVSPGATLLDFAGPAEVFGVAPTNVAEYLVAATRTPVRLENGVVVVPDYTFATAPTPDIVIIGSQAGPASAQAVAWLRKTHEADHLVMSVCTGADWLAQAGLLGGLVAATHHHAVTSFQKRYSSVRFVGGKRFVQGDAHLYTAGGYTAGLDLALHIMDQRLGRAAATKIAARLEYKGDAWITNEGWAAD